ncbi:hypothetical protein [Kribbella caucasensis]|uniref:hypothetical protein n=1 Tax=Kribbella caucasensis TaxID=2512215 RepID=UPI001414D8BC|nr:hypothetical protein [Kribbella sp. VKM Ac-2527]
MSSAGLGERDLQLERVAGRGEREDGLDTTGVWRHGGPTMGGYRSGRTLRT